MLLCTVFMWRCAYCGMLINEKLICAFRWSVLPSIIKMHGPKNKKMTYLDVSNFIEAQTLRSLIIVILDQNM